MPTNAVAPKKKPPKKGGARIAGVPVIWVGAGLIAAILVGLYFKNRAASAATTTSAAPATADTGATGGGAGASPTDLTPVSDLANSINGLTGVLGAGSGVGLGTGTSSFFTPAPATAPTASPASGQDYLQYLQSVGLFQTPATATQPGASAPGTIGGHTSSGGYVQPYPAAIVPSAPHYTATNVQPAPGAVSVKTLGSGAKLYTYASGRVEEQVPGKSAYVVKGGKK